MRKKSCLCGESYPRHYRAQKAIFEGRLGPGDRTTSRKDAKKAREEMTKHIREVEKNLLGVERSASKNREYSMGVK